MKELVIISGKGGTGKTSITASFAVLSENSVLADCDVDAADLHLVIAPEIKERSPFSGGRIARVLPQACTACGACTQVCRFDALELQGPANPMVEKTYQVNRIACEGCGVCAHFCPAQAIEMQEAINGEWYISETRCGPMVHARLGIAEENSGKLVTLVRNEAKKIAQAQQAERVLIDGSPGIGCPVIASITGADMVLIVTEATKSGLHDLERVAVLTKRFGISTLVAINKYDLNEAITQAIEEKAAALGLLVAGKVRYDTAVTLAQLKGQAVVEYSQEGCAQDIRALWETVSHCLEKHQGDQRRPLCQEAAELGSCTKDCVKNNAT